MKKKIVIKKRVIKKKEKEPATETLTTKVSLEKKSDKKLFSFLSSKKKNKTKKS